MTQKVLFRCPYGHDSEFSVEHYIEWGSHVMLVTCKTCGRHFAKKTTIVSIYSSAWGAPVSQELVVSIVEEASDISASKNQRFENEFTKGVEYWHGGKLEFVARGDVP
jgi:transcription elongation factor Elf1